ncbi:MAG: Uma2 family endonuclease [Pyrinomonadaceae bacterium]
MRAFKEQKYTLDEYFELERTSEEKWEFWDGNVWCMSGASIVHEDIVSNLLRSLGNRLPDTCRAAGSNVRVKVPQFPPYRYPDITVACGERQTEVVGGLELLVNPQAIIEILSPSTEAFDRGMKFTYYKSIPSLREYVLVTPDRASISHFIKKAENEWINQDFVGLKATLLLPTFEIEVPLSEIYHNVGFPKQGFRGPDSDGPYE